MEPPPSGEWRGEREFIMSKILKDGWNDVGGGCSVYLDSETGKVTRATRHDENGGEVTAALYKPGKDGGYDKVMPCLRCYIRHRDDLSIF